MTRAVGLVMWSMQTRRVRSVTRDQIASITSRSDSTGRSMAARTTRAPAVSQAKVQVRSTAP